MIVSIEFDEECISEEKTTLTGRVLWFNHRLNYGFIMSDEGLEVFFHRTSIDLDKLSDKDMEAFKHTATPVMQGAKVEFELNYESESPKASRVVILPRFSERGKPLLTVAFMRCDINTGCNALMGHIASKLPYGLKWVNNHGRHLQGAKF
jgi:cold shock CspA family protein